MHRTLLLLAACSTSPIVQVDTTRPADPRPTPPRAMPPAPPIAPTYDVSHILIAWDGALASPRATGRTRDEARAFALDLHRRLTTGADFAQLARKHSDCPSGARGGWLGGTRPGTMVEEFEQAVASIAPGHLTPVTETSFGFHIIRRDAVTDVELSVVLLSIGDHRSLPEATDRANQLRDEIRAGKAFADIARWHSEDRITAPQGGSFGVVARGHLPPALENSAFMLAPDEISAPIPTPWGVYLLRRHG
jgi:peptidyl-prolyl cis-trans isomerase SurA